MVSEPHRCACCAGRSRAEAELSATRKGRDEAARLVKIQAEAVANLMGLFDTPVERLHRQQRLRKSGAKDDGFYEEAIESGRAASAAVEQFLREG